MRCAGDPAGPAARRRGRGRICRGRPGVAPFAAARRMARRLRWPRHGRARSRRCARPAGRGPGKAGAAPAELRPHPRRPDRPRAGAPAGAPARSRARAQTRAQPRAQPRARSYAGYAAAGRSAVASRASVAGRRSVGRDAAARTPTRAGVGGGAAAARAGGLPRIACRRADAVTPPFCFGRSDRSRIAGTDTRAAPAAAAGRAAAAPSPRTCIRRSCRTGRAGAGADGRTGGSGTSRARACCRT
jgi:hypothetical protein